MRDGLIGYADDRPIGKQLCSVGASGSKNKSKSSSTQSSRTVFPQDFLSEYERLFGRGFTSQDILGAVPQATNLFAPTPSPTGQQSTPVGGPPAGGAPPQGAGLGFSPPVNDTPRAHAPPTPGGERTLNMGDVLQIASRFGSNNQMDPAHMTQLVANQVWTIIGHKPEANEAIPEGVMRDAIARAGAIAKKPDIAQGLAGGIENYFGLREARAQPTLPSTDPAQVGIDVQGGIRNLGFGAAPTERAGEIPGMIREAPTITPIDVGNAQANIAPEGFKQYGEDIFQSLYQPVVREEQRRGAIEDRELQAQLAQAGIQSSGAGIGQQQVQRNERQQRIFAAAQDAASRASVQRFGTEFAQEQQNATMRQEQNLARANLDAAAQTENAANILRGDTARAGAYLQAIGLDDQRAQAARAQFLDMLGLQQRELDRLDQSARARIELAMNSWLQQFAALSNAGEISLGASKSKGTGTSGSGEISYGTAGGQSGGGGGGGGTWT